MVTVAVNQGLGDANVLLRPFRAVESSHKLSFDANRTTNSSIFTVGSGDRLVDGCRRHCGGSNLKIPLSFGKGQSALFDGKGAGNACGGRKSVKASSEDSGRGVCDLNGRMSSPLSSSEECSSIFSSGLVIFSCNESKDIFKGRPEDRRANGLPSLFARLRWF